MRECDFCKARSKCLLYKESKQGFGFSVPKEEWEKECKRQYESIVGRKEG